MSDITLSDEQQLAVDNVSKWHEATTSNLGINNEYKLGGYAGTGKTTVIKSILDSFNQDYKTVSIAAFTGKAVNVLQRKGLSSAQTLHSMMYDVIDMGNGVIDFEKKVRLDIRPKLIIIDEASMISVDLYEDLKSFNVPCLFVGDPGQLEPVGENPNLMKEPDFVLQTIHRQALHSPIITFANHVRQGGSIAINSNGGIVEKDCALVLRKKGSFIAGDYDQIICAKNKTRVGINQLFREKDKKPTKSLIPGDKIIILRNNASFGVFNGMILFLDEVMDNPTKDWWIVSAKDETGKEFKRLPIWKIPFQVPMEAGTQSIPPKFVDETTAKMERLPNVCIADFGYCITCHKSQGSEWPRVLVWDEYVPPKIWDMKRWRYTAITRAARELTYCL